jgi:hemerythrin-like domain-containing protein
MLLKSKTVEVLCDQHNEIRQFLKVLKNKAIPIETRKQTFSRMLPVLLDHFDREETVIYKFMLDSPAADLKFMATAGEGEHLIAANLASELENDELTPVQWSKKSTVFYRFIESHLEDEENCVFPRLNESINPSTDADLFYRYENFYGFFKQKESSSLTTF